MFIQAGEQSFTFAKPTTREAVCASRIRLLRDADAEFATVPLRVVCALRAAEKHGGEPCVRIDYFVEAKWCPPGARLGWHDITDTLRKEDDERARVLFAETAEEALVIDRAIEKILGIGAAMGARSVAVATGGAL